MRRTLRTIQVEAEQALIEKTCSKVLVARDWLLLIRIAEIVKADPDIELARHDPSRFILLRNGITHWHVNRMSRITPDRIRYMLARYGISVQEPRMADIARKILARRSSSSKP